MKEGDSQKVFGGKERIEKGCARGARWALHGK